MKKSNLFYIFPVIFFFSIYVNYLSGNIGILPIDSFAFFDTSFLILKGYHPLKDFWITTGFLVDYIQSFFFKILGVSWFSYVAHAAFFNFFFTICLFFFFYYNKLNLYISLFYSLAISILFYPNIGTPFAYHHSFLFSLLSVVILLQIIKRSKQILWFLLPATMIVSFFCMQTPSAYINLLIIFFLIFILIKQTEKFKLNSFLLGSFLSIISIVSIFIFAGIPFQNFYEQYILFPFSIGTDRISSSEYAFVTLASKINLKTIFLDFKFLNLILLLFIYTNFRIYKLDPGRRSENLQFFLLIFFSVVILIFNQLLTANQIYIFSLIPILAGITHLQINKKMKENKILISILMILVLVSTFKYHERFNINRKFIDLENINLSSKIDASEIDKKLENLEWINRHHKNTEKEIKNVNYAIDLIKQEKRDKMVITQYQFFSAILNENLNIPNRWYTHDNNSYPLITHKHAKFYSKFLQRKINENKIQIIFIIDATQKNDLKISNFKEYLKDVCFSDKIIINNFFSSHEITKCKN